MKLSLVLERALAIIESRISVTTNAMSADEAWSDEARADEARADDIVPNFQEHLASFTAKL